MFCCLNEGAIALLVDLTKVCHHILKPNTHFCSKERKRDELCECFNLGIIEDAHHIIMQCPYFECIGREMYNQIKCIFKAPLSEMGETKILSFSLNPSFSLVPCPTIGHFGSFKENGAYSKRPWMRLVILKYKYMTVFWKFCRTGKNKAAAPCEDRTHDLQIMRLTRCLLR